MSEGKIVILLITLTPSASKLTAGRSMSFVSKVGEVSVYPDSWGEVSEIFINLRGG